MSHIPVWMRNATVVLSLYSLIGAINAHGLDTCSDSIKEIPIKTVVASAGMWANMFKRTGSLSYESNVIFHEAKDKAKALAAPEDFCPAGCKPSKRPILFFRSSPRVVLTEYAEADHCNLLQEKSSKAPYRYHWAQFHTIDELDEWIADLSQGSGVDGEDLYSRCDGSCSPRYEYMIVKSNDEPETYSVNAAVICGPARDKDDNHYNLDAFFRWVCERTS